ncbi:MAG TPA: DUF5985 family protein [Rhizomicrobium sp.]|nr:DUF5985 family protein [Rhizomicrobium sp.]
MSEWEPTIAAYAAGLLTMGFLTVGLFFVRFWRRTGDLLFACFGIAFSLMALNQAIPVLLSIPREEQAGIYLLRLAAYAVIIAAILMKNIGDDKGSR